MPQTIAIPRPAGIKTVWTWEQNKARKEAEASIHPDAHGKASPLPGPTFHNLVGQPTLLPMVILPNHKAGFQNFITELSFWSDALSQSSSTGNPITISKKQCEWVIRPIADKGPRPPGVFAFVSRRTRTADIQVSSHRLVFDETKGDIKPETIRLPDKSYILKDSYETIRTFRLPALTYTWIPRLDDRGGVGDQDKSLTKTSASQPNPYFNYALRTACKEVMISKITNLPFRNLQPINWFSHFPSLCTEPEGMSLPRLICTPPVFNVLTGNGQAFRRVCFGANPAPEEFDAFADAYERTICNEDTAQVSEVQGYAAQYKCRQWPPTKAEVLVYGDCREENSKKTWTITPFLHSLGNCDAVILIERFRLPGAVFAQWFRKVTTVRQNLRHYAHSPNGYIPLYRALLKINGVPRPVYATRFWEAPPMQDTELEIQDAFVHYDHEIGAHLGSFPVGSIKYLSKPSKPPFPTRR